MKRSPLWRPGAAQIVSAATVLGVVAALAVVAAGRAAGPGQREGVRPGWASGPRRGSAAGHDGIGRDGPGSWRRSAARSIH